MYFSFSNNKIIHKYKKNVVKNPKFMLHVSLVFRSQFCFQKKEIIFLSTKIIY
jgi:hypothetical protein